MDLDDDDVCDYDYDYDDVYDFDYDYDDGNTKSKQWIWTTAMVLTFTNMSMQCC